MTTYNAKSGTACAICGEPVVMEDAKTDDNGGIVHEDCYVRNVVEGPVTEEGGG